VGGDRVAEVAGVADQRPSRSGALAQIGGDPRECPQPGRVPDGGNERLQVRRGGAKNVSIEIGKPVTADL
jgi:hypothetical protein